MDKIINLDIPDIYRYGEQALIEQLEISHEVHQFEELLIEIASPSSASAAFALFDASDEELSQTYKTRINRNKAVIQVTVGRKM